MNKFVLTARHGYSKLALGGAILAASAGAMAQATTPFQTIMAAVDLTTVSASVVALALLIIGIAMAFKAPDLGKRVIRKV